MNSGRPVIFLIWFSLLFGAMYAGYFFVPDSFLRDVVYHHGICAIGADMVNLIVPGEDAVAIDNTIASEWAILEIVRGCDGAGALFLLLAAVIAFPTSIAAKGIGVFAAILFGYLVNQFRIVTLYFVAAYQPDWFTLLHSYFLPMLVILLYAVAFAFWANQSRGAA